MRVDSIADFLNRETLTLLKYCSISPRAEKFAGMWLICRQWSARIHGCSVWMLPEAIQLASSLHCAKDNNPY